MKKIRNKKSRNEKNRIIRYFAGYISDTQKLRQHINNECIGITTNGVCNNLLHRIGQEEYISILTPNLPEELNPFLLSKFKSYY